MSDQAMAADAGRAARAPVGRMIGGIALLCAGFLGSFFLGSLGLDGLRPFLPLLMVAGIVVFGTGLHKALWAPPRDTSSIPPALRPVVSALAALAVAAGISFVGGLVVGLLRAIR